MDTTEDSRQITEGHLELGAAALTLENLFPEAYVALQLLSELNRLAATGEGYDWDTLLPASVILA